MTIDENIFLREYTTFKLGGPARFFCVVKSEEDLVGALAFARTHAVPFFILGGGSNVLAGDDGFSGLVIKIELKGVSRVLGMDGVVMVTAGAGEEWDALVGQTVAWGFAGLENLSAIPGTVGAAPVQNIGAYGVEVRDTIESVRIFDTTTGAARTLTHEQCQFSYRDSFFKTPAGKKCIILSVSFRLRDTRRQGFQPNISYKDLSTYFSPQLDMMGIERTPTLSAVRTAVIAIRSGKFPDLATTGTAGSFWKNPIISIADFERLSSLYPDIPSFPAGDKVKISLAWILDRVCGLKGHSRGSVGLFKHQPLVLIAEKGATASEVNTFVDEIATQVKEKTGIIIEREVLSI